MRLTNEQIQASETLYLEMAIDTIRLNAISNRVQAARAAMGQSNMTAQPTQAIIRTMTPYKMALRIAAAIIIMLSSATIYKYTSVNTQTLYDREFTDYALSATRAVNAADAQADAFRDQQWNQVISIYTGEASRTNRSRFLAGMAGLELKKYPEAVTMFEGLLKNNSDESFREEAEYYLALAYLAAHQESKGLELIAQIKANPNHTYYPLANQIPVIDLKIIELKKN